MSERIIQALIKKFDRHRIVFWYDVDQELRKEYEAVELPRVSKLEILNNEFSLKYRLLREEPETRFLLYKEGSPPADVDNWLLDVQLAQGEFRADQVAMWLADLGLGYEFADLVKEHQEFFNAKKRLESLQEIVSPDDTPSRLRLKMVAVCAGSDGRLDTILETLLDELSQEKTDRLDVIERANLKDFLWEQVHKNYGYQADDGNPRDFVIELFKSCYAMGTEGAVQLNTEALVFLKRWKDSRQHEKAFETLSEQCAEILGIAQGLNQSDYRKIIDLDYFELIDRRILSELVSAVKNRTITAGECTQYIRERRNGHWFSKYRNEYEAVDYAAQFLMAVENAIVEVESLAQGVEAYVNTLYRVDQLYRKFLYFVQQSRQATLLNPLADEIRGHYTNSYLRPLSDHWQGQVDKLSKWEIPGEVSQDKFYQRWIWPYTDKKRKIFVIISDAMRYEVGEELSRQIRSEDRYDSELKHVIAKLPCYTQLGMASLLPNKAIQINEDKSASVAVDGQSTQGLTNRGTILDSAISAKALAIQAEEFLTKNQDECRQLTKDHDVIYIYQNRIDKVGHSRDSEKNAFKAVEEAIDELVKLVKKLFGANASNVLVTADHGFVYQDEVVEESDFSIAEPTGDIYYTDRRFMLGHNISEVEGVKKFTAEQLGLQGDLEVVIPKSINRFRKKGSATRFMHGGCTLQEIVLPVVEVNKSRTSDVSMVGVDLLPVSSSVISSGQLSVAFYQTEPVTEKVQARTLKVGLYAPDGQLISDAHELIFDLTSENPREREIKQRFVLSKEADQYNNQQVMLRLQEPISGTSHFQEYKAISYKLQRSFLGDFDF